MRYTNFVRAAWGLAAVGLVVVLWGPVCASRSAPPVPPGQVQQQPVQAQPMQAPPPAPAPPPVAHGPRVTVPEVRTQLEGWLAAHGDRQGKMKLVDILPAASFRATAIRFPDADAARFSDDPGQWSQIRLDLDRDGVDDEKWLLRNGHTYKRETLDRQGRSLSAEYFDR